MAHNDGGKVCRNKKLVRTLRAIARQLLHEIGRQILSGSMNLTTISFPIRAMIPKSALEKILMASCLFPLYINRACSEENPIERVRFPAVTLAQTRHMCYARQFLPKLLLPQALKPNPWGDNLRILYRRYYMLC